MTKTALGVVAQAATLTLRAARPAAGALLFTMVFGCSAESRAPATPAAAPALPTPTSGSAATPAPAPAAEAAPSDLAATRVDPRKVPVPSADAPSRGPVDAPVTVQVFSDFECPFCARGRENVAKVMAKYEGKVRLVFRQFPLSFHAHAKKAGEAALCANAQDKFWAYHDALFTEQKKLSSDDLKATAKTLGLDEKAFATSLDSGAMEKALAADMAAGAKAGVTGTPAFFINGVMLSGAQGPEAFERIIDQELAGS